MQYLQPKGHLRLDEGLLQLQGGIYDAKDIYGIYDAKDIYDTYNLRVYIIDSIY